EGRTLARIYLAGARDRALHLPLPARLLRRRPPALVDRPGGAGLARAARLRRRRHARPAEDQGLLAAAAPPPRAAGSTALARRVRRRQERRDLGRLSAGVARGGPRGGHRPPDDLPALRAARWRGTVPARGPGRLHHGARGR